MPYFKNNDVNMLVLHVPKTGGTSVEIYLSTKYRIPFDNSSLFHGKPGFSVALQHLTYRDICESEELYKTIDLHNLRIVTVVRDPYHRIMSDLFYWKLIQPDTPPERVYEVIQAHVLNNRCHNHNIPQYEFITDKSGNLVPEIKIMRTETLTEDMHAYGFRDFTLVCNKNGHNVNYDHYLNDDSIQLINTFYAKDFQLLGYPMKTAATPKSVPI